MTTTHGRNGVALGGAGVDQSVRYFLDEIGSDVSTLLGPAVVLVAIIGTLRIALHQPDQTATPTTKSRRTPRSSDVAPAPAATPDANPGGGRHVPAPAMRTSVIPAGFHWDEVGPVPRFRSGFALVVILAAVGALLAVVVAGIVLAAASALRSSLG
jgi:hypothetical protein